MKDQKVWNFDIKPTDGATIFAYLGKIGDLNIFVTEIKSERWKIQRIWRDLNPGHFRVLPTKPYIVRGWLKGNTL